MTRLQKVLYITLGPVLWVALIVGSIKGYKYDYGFGKGMLTYDLLLVTAGAFCIWAGRGGFEILGRFKNWTLTVWIMLVLTALIVSTFMVSYPGLFGVTPQYNGYGVVINPLIHRAYIVLACSLIFLAITLLCVALFGKWEEAFEWLNETIGRWAERASEQLEQNAKSTKR